MATETMVQALEEIRKVLTNYGEGMYTEQETGDTIFLIWNDCKERNDLANKSAG